MARVGLIVNPIAGMGGRVNLKGTDGADVLAQARALGAVPAAADRADRALGRLAGRSAGLAVVAAPGQMGADIAGRHPFELEPLHAARADHEATTAADTRAAAAELLEAQVDLILFAGGDGTARDINAVVGERLPVLGIPTGVKMHSGVFASSPESAGDVAASFLAAAGRAPVREADVIDLDEDLARDGAISTRLFGAARVPDDRLRLPGAKSSPAPTDEAALDAVCAAVSDAFDPRRIYVLGPGTTMRRLARHLGLPKTLLGVDAIRASRLVGADLGERELLELLEDEPATVVVGVVGGQGVLLGRGNQQLSPAVLRRVGTENIEVIAGLRKLLELEPAVLHVDTGDPELDASLCGYRRVHVAPRRTLVCRVAA